MPSPKHQAAKPGYLDAYEKEIEREGKMRQESCERLGAKWTEPRKDPKKRRCPRCKRWLAAHDYRERKVLTHFGEVSFRRHYYHCENCGAGFFHRDEFLGLDREDYTPDLIALALDFIVNSTMREASERMELHHGVRISATGLQRLFERQSAPLADAKEPAPPALLPLREDNRHAPAVVMVDGSMLRHRDGWHETKLMRVGALCGVDDVFLAETGEIARLEQQLLNSPGACELRRRKVLWLGDGAPWLWNMQQRICPYAYVLLDYYHAKKHLYDCVKVVFAEHGDLGEIFVDAVVRGLLAGEVEQVIADLRLCAWQETEAAKRKEEMTALLDLADYYEANKTRMDYKLFLERGWPIGSGAIESAHVMVLQKRLKMPGMRWNAVNLQRMATLRALYKSVGPKRFYPTLETTLKAA